MYIVISDRGYVKRVCEDYKSACLVYEEFCRADEFVEMINADTKESVMQSW